MALGEIGFQTTFELQDLFPSFLLHQPITGGFEQVGVIKRIHMLRAFVGAVFWNHRIRREADEVDAFALGEHLSDFRVLFRLRQFGGKLGFGVGDFVLLQHFADLRHACRCLRIGGGNGVDEFRLHQRFQHVDVPLAADEHRSGKKIRFDTVQVEGNHAAHGLAGGINAVGVNRFFSHQASDEAQGHTDFIRGLPLVVYRRFGVERHEDEGGMFHLRFVEAAFQTT